MSNAKVPGTAQVLIRSLDEAFVKDYMQGHGAKYERLEGMILVAVSGPQACARLQQLANEDAQAQRLPKE